MDDALAALNRVHDGLRICDIPLPDLDMVREQAWNGLVYGQCPDGISCIAEGLNDPGAQGARRACHKDKGFLIGFGHDLKFSRLQQLPIDSQGL